MDEENLILTISGAALSLLLFENAQCAATEGDQIGFILGEVVDYMTKVVTDNEKDTHHRKRHINVHTVLAYPPITPFFDGHGQISEKMLDNFLKEKKSSVIGWFRFKNYELPGIGQNPNHAPVLTYRENKLHQNLKRLFARDNIILLETFVLLYLSTAISAAEGTHTFKQLALIGDDNLGMEQYRPIPIKINNLGFDASRPSGSDYKLKPIKYTDEKDFFTSFCEKIIKENSNDPLSALETVQESVASMLNRTADELSISDAENNHLRIRINDLRRRIFMKKLQNQQKELEENKLADEKMNFSDADSQDTLYLEDQEIERQDSSPVLGKSAQGDRKLRIIDDSDDAQESDAEIQVLSSNKEIIKAESQRSRPVKPGKL